MPQHVRCRGEELPVRRPWLCPSTLGRLTVENPDMSDGWLGLGPAATIILIPCRQPTTLRKHFVQRNLPCRPHGRRIVRRGSRAPMYLWLWVVAPDRASAYASALIADSPRAGSNAGRPGHHGGHRRRPIPPVRHGDAVPQNSLLVQPLKVTEVLCRAGATDVRDEAGRGGRGYLTAAASSAGPICSRVGAR